MRLLSAAVVALVLSTSVLANEPDVRCFDSDCRVFFWKPVTIDAGFVKVFDQLEAQGKKVTYLDVSASPGGDVYGAMRVGRLLRKWSTRISIGDRCASACVMLVAGAVWRYELRDGQLGLHRPYRPDSGITDTIKAQANYQRANTDIEQYLKDMNVQTSLLAAMNSVSPQNVRWITRREADAFGLVELDPVYEEVTQEERAKQLGISRAELLSRISRREKECDPLPMTERTACVSRIGLAPNRRQ